ncbi:1-acyl-sn-glycerol-3-phosphate acyltransferase [Porphyromonas pogonae]|uniref:1-acyl-sn-glycerol-3-phosphate acyltransferase n=1 Tax=Porphyromonas pogonae TaxID=867595 RepID=UPI002E790DAA|nr:1-acyl-sn-glycerol-3-phosphate acyltransferase [Porphyromonas pogonae]
MNESLEINIADIIKRKSGRNLPQWQTRLIERLIHQDEINYILRTYGHLDGVQFMEALIEYFQVDIGWEREDRLPTSHGRYIFACNHPLGAFDGICLSYLLGRKYGDVRYVVNDLLFHLKPLQSIFVPVNKLGAQKRESIQRMHEVLMGDLPVGTFPAGICSRFINGRIQDMAWQKSFVNHAITYRRDIVPLHFVGRNSIHFYQIELIRKLFSLKFNVGSALLPDEMFRSKRKNYKVIVGEPIPWQSLKESGEKPIDIAARIRDISYKLRTQSK